MEETAIRELVERTSRIERKIDLIGEALGIGAMRDIMGSDNVPVSVAREREIGRISEVLRGMTTLQHGVLQMLLAGKQNRDIEERFGVTLNTVKAYVRGLTRKFGVKTRQELAVKVYPVFEDIPDRDYRVMSGGLPKYWYRDYGDTKRYDSLFRRKGDHEEE